MQNELKWFKNQCREHNIRLTPQRIAIYETLTFSDDHPSAEMICKRVREKFPNVSLDTVNRTLLTFSQIGAAFIVEGGGDVRRFDAEMGNHQHFKCVKCKRIVDFHHKPFNNIEIPKEITGKFEVLRQTVYLEGLCDKCINNSNSNSNSSSTKQN